MLLPNVHILHDMQLFAFITHWYRYIFPFGALSAPGKAKEGDALAALSDILFLEYTDLQNIIRVIV